jgi:predicted metal-dependent phosphotriesterase family hydrolase
LQGLATRGATVGLDRFFATDDAYVAQRSAIALELIRAGYAEQVSLGHDASSAGFWGRWQDPNPECWSRVPDLELPWLLANGASEDDVDAVMRRSVRASFEAAAAMARRD